MYRNLSLATKLYTGFGSVLLLLLLVGGISFYSFSSVRQAADQVTSASDLGFSLLQREVDHLKWASQVSNLFLDDNVTKLKVQLDPTKCALGHWLYGPAGKAALAADPTLARIIKQLEQPHITLHQSAKEINRLYTPMNDGVERFLSQIMLKHSNWLHKLENSVLTGQPFKGHLDYKTCAFGKWYYGPQGRAMIQQYPALKPLLKAWEEPHQRLHQSAALIVEKMAQGKLAEAKSIFEQQTEPAAAEFKQAQEATLDYIRRALANQKAAVKVFHDSTQPALRQVQAVLKQANDHTKNIAEQERRQISRTVVNSQLIIGLGSLVAIVIALGAAFFITRLIARPIKQTVDMLHDIAEGEGDLTVRLAVHSTDEIGQLSTEFNRFVGKIQEIMLLVADVSDTVTQAAGEIATGNISMAERTQEQASGVEETAATLEEMTGNVKQNAANASQANSESQETAKLAVDGDKVVKNAVATMADVAKSSHKIAEIIDVVNEIAFQTNLLALNASVEAARAGEAGRGFAVVAGEVRNLAGRTAEAAKEIQGLIQKSVKTVDEGNRLVTQSGERLTEIIGGVRRVADSVGEISAASREQATAIEEINRAVTEMDNVVQQDAAMVEELSSTAESLSAEAKRLSDLVNRFKLRDGDQDHFSGGEARMVEPTSLLE